MTAYRVLCETNTRYEINISVYYEQHANLELIKKQYVFGSKMICINQNKFPVLSSSVYLTSLLSMNGVSLKHLDQFLVRVEPSRP